MQQIQLTDMQSKILAALPKAEFIFLRSLSDKLGMSSDHIRVQIGKLEASGHLTVGNPEYRNAPLRIKIISLVEGLRPDFDKLLFSTRWV